MQAAMHKAGKTGPRGGMLLAKAPDEAEAAGLDMHKEPPMQAALGRGVVRAAQTDDDKRVQHWSREEAARREVTLERRTELEAKRVQRKNREEYFRHGDGSEKRAAEPSTGPAGKKFQAIAATGLLKRY